MHCTLFYTWPALHLYVYIYNMLDIFRPYHIFEKPRKIVLSKIRELIVITSVTFENQACQAFSTVKALFTTVCKLASLRACLIATKFALWYFSIPLTGTLLHVTKNEHQRLK